MDAVTPAPQSRQTVFIPTDLIDVRDRLREIDWGWAEALRVSFERRRMFNPIVVEALAGGRYRLIAGAHRWAAHTLMEQPVECFVAEAMDWAEARGCEIDENVFRRELSPLDRAAFITELYEVEKARHGWEEGQSKQAFVASKRWAKDASVTMTLASGLADNVAAKVGLSKETIYRDLALHKALSPVLAHALATAAPDTPTGQLKALAKLDPERQAAVAAAVVNGRPVSELLAGNGAAAAPASPEQKRHDAFIGAWSRMGLRERKAALAALAELGLPKGFTLTMPEQSND